MKRIAIFASGSGSNAEALMEHFEKNAKGRIALVLTNKADAYVLQRAERFGVPTHTFAARTLREEPRAVIEVLNQHQIDLVVLAGFMLLVPAELVAAFPIVNIHPALLPKYGGKGMYGHHVHEAVVAAQEKQSGITIHRVDERYDQGAILCQATVDVAPSDTPDTLAEKIHRLEHRYYPVVVEQLCDE